MSRKTLATLHNKGDRTLDDDMSWAIFALKVIIGENDFRNYYLNSIFKSDVNHLFTMAGEEYTNMDLIAKLKDVSTIKDNMVAFTVAQKASMGNPTHYIGFVVMKEEERLYILDPVMGAGGFDYSADEETNVVRNHFKSYSHVFIQPSYTACQTSANDTYCQSWSLWLIRKFLKHYGKGGRMTMKKKGDARVCSINFFNTKKKLNEEKRVMVLKRDLLTPIIKMFGDASDTTLTSGVAGNHLDLELQYMKLRDDYGELVEFTPGVYRAFYRTKFGKSLSGIGIKKRGGNKLAKTRGDVVDEALGLLKVVNKHDLLA